ncbi:MAG: epimerase, partial [Acidobacteriota bacterium]|nr:epimerase [Acidobacteriota bacterium]
TFVQLVGVPRPSPAKARQFSEIDLASGRASVGAARSANVRHFVYVSVAQPAPVMKAYQEVRAEVESLLRESGVRATVLRPWYVLGPGHRWPYLLLPFYKLMERLPSKRETALRLGLVTHAQMVAALVRAVEDPAQAFRVVTVPEIRMMNAEGGRMN